MVTSSLDPVWTATNEIGESLVNFQVGLEVVVGSQNCGHGDLSFVERNFVDYEDAVNVVKHVQSLLIEITALNKMKF